jgi:GMP synthase-like glutamine amidotransferase
MVGLAPSHKSQLSNYTSWLDKRGFKYKILEKNDSAINFDMLILCGGPDVGSSPERDENETKWFKEAYGNIPVLGICRGLQLSNVLLGGTLYEDLSEEKIKHSSNKIAISGEPQPLLESSWHDVILDDGKRIKVNSRHHQGIKDLAPGLTTLGICADDNLNEIVSGNKALFVQWHPERPDVWGTDAEQIVYEWIKQFIIPSAPVSPIEQIVNYVKRKNFTVVSNERIRKSINESFTDNFIDSLIKNNSHKLKRVTDKHGRIAVKILN